MPEIRQNVPGPTSQQPVF